jgi:uroporphyrinogen decarboxylase
MKTFPAKGGVKQLDRRERVKSCIRFDKSSFVPWHVDFTSEIGSKLMSAFGLAEGDRRVRGVNVHRFNALNDRFGNHLCYLRGEAVDASRMVGPGVSEDEWGILWDRSVDKDIGVPLNRVLGTRDAGRLNVPDPDDPARFEHFAPVIEANPGRYLLVKVSRCLFERAWSLRGMEELFVDFVEAPDFVEELLDRLADFSIRLIGNLSTFPVDGIRFSDDWGWQHGLLLSPAMWRRFLKPRLKRMYDQARAQGYDVFIHSCGQVSAVMEDLVEIGVNVFNPIQPEVMDVHETVRAFAGRLAFNGGISIQKTLPFGTPGDVRKEVESRLRTARAFGGFVLAPSHDMTPDIPVRNVEEMLEVLKGQAG